MKRFLTIVALTCILSVSALAGEMPTMGTPAPASSGMQSSMAAKVVLTLIGLLGR